MIRARQLSLTLAAAGLAVVASGCGADNIVGGERPAPGLAAQVDDARLDLDDVDLLTGAICSSLEEDPTAQPTSRALVQKNVVQAWVLSETARVLVAEQDADVDVPRTQYDLIPGWADFSEDEQDVVRTYIDALQYLEAATPEVGDDEGRIDTSAVDVTINPRYDLTADGTVETADLQTSVAVSAEALAGTAEQLDPEQLEALPDGQLCGSRTPAAQAPPLAPQ